MAELARLEHRGPVAEVVLNRPDKRNAINWELMQALDSCLDRAARLPEARAVLIRGEGPCFSAGIDIAGLMTAAQQFGEGWRDNLMPLTQAYQAVVNKAERHVLPTIALLHGHTLGLGLELALACDMRICAEGTRMALPETRLGLIPDVGGTTRLTRLIGPARAKEVILTAREVTTDEAAAWGMVNHVVPGDELLQRGEALVEQISACAPLAVSLGKRVIDGLADVDRGLTLEAIAQTNLIKTEDMMAGAMAFMSKTKPTWKGK